MKKNILAILYGDFQKLYFKKVQAKYNVYFHIFDFQRDPKEEIENILSFLRKNNIQLHGVFGVNDEPSLIASQVAELLGLPGPTSLSIYQGLHKAIFARHAEKVNQYYPKTTIITNSENVPQGITYPAFIKPARSSTSVGAFQVTNETELKKKIHYLFEQELKETTWFAYYAKTYNEKKYPVQSLILQPHITAKQYTVDGYLFEGNMTILGVTKSIFTKDKKSFDRFVFPSLLSKKTFVELKETLKKLFQEIQLDNTNFNVEFFVYKQHIILIELNTRLSIQFSSLMDKWYTMNNLDIAAHIALGITPPLKALRNKKMAISHVLRTKTDKYISKVPSKKQIHQLITSGYADLIQVLIDPGKKLSDYRQDEYSYRYAIIDISGKTEKEIRKKFLYVKKTLSFEFKNV